jgi:serine/threonine protein kinase
MIVLACLLAIPLGIVAIVYIFVPFFKGIGWLVRQVFRFIFGEIGDVLRLIGTVITSLVFVPLVVINVLIGRWSAAAHFGRAISAEMHTLVAALYRIAIGHPARLLCLTALTEGIERRLPQAIAQAPTSDVPARAKGRFDGYTIVGSLPGGGSGGKLYIAEPEAIRRAAFERAGQLGVKQVVIKVFSLDDGSSLPQIVRESRALEAAKKLGLVLDHELTNERFYYVMRYVPGDSLSLVTQRLHALSGAEGLSYPQLRLALGYGADLLGTLSQYHKGGLWHKDVKPDNIIVDAESAHLVDFGLVTPLRSGMTLTTHGTEYFRDPEMVRLALKGVKVHQVDGARFDLYAAGAVLYSMVENSFPAHGGLSQITKGCPEALRWIIRRAMTEYDKRYTSADQMLADLDVVRRAADPFSVKPADLPSMRGTFVEDPAVSNADAFAAPSFDPVAIGAAAGTTPPPLNNPGAFDVPPPLPRQEPAGSTTGAFRARPNLRVTNWWSGKYERDEGGSPRSTPPGFVGIDVPGVRVGIIRPEGARSAADQLNAARTRVAERRHRARTRVQSRRAARGRHQPVNFGVLFAALIFVAFIAMLFNVFSKRAASSITISHEHDQARGEFSLLAEVPEAPDAPATPGAPTPTTPAAASQRIRVENPTRPSPRVIISGATASTHDITGLSGQHVLVISDVQPATPNITTTIERLRSAGLDLIGNYPGNTAAQDEKQLDRAAEARMIRGLRSIDDTEFRDQLSHWLADTDLAGVLWFARSPAPDDQPRRTTHALFVLPQSDQAMPSGESRNALIMDVISEIVGSN